MPMVIYIYIYLSMGCIYDWSKKIAIIAQYYKIDNISDKEKTGKIY